MDLPEFRSLGAQNVEHILTCNIRHANLVLNPSLAAFRILLCMFDGVLAGSFAAAGSAHAGTRVLPSAVRGRCHRCAQFGVLRTCHVTPACMCGMLSQTLSSTCRLALLLYHISSGTNLFAGSAAPSAPWQKQRARAWRRRRAVLLLSFL